MPCYHPLDAFRDLDPYAHKKIVFPRSKGQPAPLGCQKIQLPCGQCSGCRLTRSRQWAMRCIHEASLYDNNCFITLTYNDEHLPENSSLVKEDFQKFMKRFRKKFPNKKIRYYMCGEYGDKNGRPHYHAIIFNHDWKDKKLFKNINGESLFTSKTLDDLWSQNKNSMGYATSGSVTFESAAYVARYVMKKMNGQMAESHYTKQKLDEDGLPIFSTKTGEIKTYTIKPEYNAMSRRPGIASDWLKKYMSDVYPSDFITRDGKKMKPPKFYDLMYEHDSPEEWEILKEKRRLDFSKHKGDNTPERLLVKEKVKAAQMEKLIRTL